MTNMAILVILFLAFFAFVYQSSISSIELLKAENQIFKENSLVYKTSLAQKQIQELYSGELQ